MPLSPLPILWLLNVSYTDVVIVRIHAQVVVVKIVVDVYVRIVVDDGVDVAMDVRMASLVRISGAKDGVVRTSGEVVRVAAGVVASLASRRVARAVVVRPGMGLLVVDGIMPLSGTHLPIGVVMHGMVSLAGRILR